MSNYEDDLCVLPHVGPDNQKKLRDEGYGSYAAIARAGMMDLTRDVGITLSHAPEIINSALDQLDCSCPMCNAENISPIWGGYPGGNLDVEAQKTMDFFCLDCMWVGMYADFSSDSTTPTVDEAPTVDTALTH
jgi:hypothetical protein